MFRFNHEISYGHIMQAGLVVVGLVAGYYQLKADDAAILSAMRLLKTESDARTERLFMEANARIANNSGQIETNSRVIAEQLKAINAALADVRDELKAARHRSSLNRP